MMEKLGTYEKALYFLKLVREEVKKSESLYGEEDAKILKQYYHYLQEGGARFYANQHCYAERVTPLIRLLTEKNKKVLDAGCCTGTETILGGILGMDVTGIYIKEERLDVAKKRIKYYENKMNIKINVNIKIEVIIRRKIFFFLQNI